MVRGVHFFPSGVGLGIVISAAPLMKILGIISLEMVQPGAFS